MMTIFIIISIIFIIDYICNFVNYLYARRLYLSPPQKSKKDESNLYLIIPVYKEERIIKELINHFKKVANNNTKIVIVATKKEKDDLTYNLAKKYISNNKNFILLKYNNENGIMANQLNYAIDYIDTIDKSNYIIGIYNADSVIKKEHLDFVRYNIKNNNCIQQYSYFSSNKKLIINDAIKWQNRWSVIFEAGRCNNNLLNNMNYVIGHGFFIKSNSIKKCGYFSEDTINEDAILGVILNYLDIKIVPMPYFEKADFVLKIKEYIKQQSSWWNGPKQAFKYFKIIINKKDNNKYKRDIYDGKFIKLFVICFKLFLHAIYWLMGIYIMLFLYGYVSYQIFGISGLIMVILLNYLNLELWDYLAYRIIKKTTKDNSLTYYFIKTPLTFYLFHSFGPILNIIKSIIGTNTINKKYKTER